MFKPLYLPKSRCVTREKIILMRRPLEHMALSARDGEKTVVFRADFTFVPRISCLTSEDGGSEL